MVEPKVEWPLAPLMKSQLSALPLSIPPDPLLLVEWCQRAVPMREGDQESKQLFTIPLFL